MAKNTKSPDRFVWSEYLDGLKKATPKELIARIVELVRVIDNAEDVFRKQQRTIRRQRRAIRRLKRLLDSKDRLLASQKSFYEEMDKATKADAPKP